MHSKLQLFFIRIYFTVVSHIFPSLAVRSAYKLFHYPVNTKRKYNNEKPLPQAQTFLIPLYTNTSLKGYRWGDEKLPIVLLIHGWSTTSRSMSHFTYALLKANYQVVTYDALRHGETVASLSDLSNWADSVRATLKHIGPVECIIAHSFGGAAVTVASKLGLDTKKLVLIAPIYDVISVSEKFAKHLHIPLSIVAKMRQYTWDQNKKGFRKYGTNWEDIFKSDFHVPTLIFHDKEDREIGIEHSKTLCQKWTWATLNTTIKLGHRKILDNAEVVTKTVAFIRSSQ